jgi:hypothetical protein
MSARTPEMSSAAPQAHPIFQPVQLNIFAALEIVSVRAVVRLSYG